MTAAPNPTKIRLRVRLGSTAALVVLLMNASLHSMTCGAMPRGWKG